MQHIAKSLKPDGKAIVVMSQGILFRGQPKLTEEEDGRNKKADDEYLIRSGFLKDDLIEAVVVLPSGIFYGNNVPACLAILNKRKHAARKDRVLMIWASRHYQHANPQSIMRRADCLHTLLPWRAFGDLAKALEILPAEGQAITDLRRICSEPEEARRYFVIADKAEIEENEYSLNSEANDTLISVRAPVGELCRADRQYALGRGVAAMRPISLDSDFFFHAMHRWRRPLARAAQGYRS